MTNIAKKRKKKNKGINEKSITGVKENTSITLNVLDAENRLPTVLTIRGNTRNVRVNRETSIRRLPLIARVKLIRIEVILNF